PKKGTGQTATAINFAAMASKITEERVMLVDTNKFHKDIETYLSNSEMNKGLDEFINFHKTNILEELTNTYMYSKKVHKNFDMMSSNQSYDLEETDIEMLIKNTKKTHPITVIDTIASINKITNYLLEVSDVILMILNQESNIIKKIKDNKIYSKQNKKIVFIVNRYIEKFRDKKVTYKIFDIEKDLRKIGFEKNLIFTLDYCIDLLNNCNDGTLLKTVFEGDVDKTEYFKDLYEITKEVLSKYGGYEFKNKEATNKNTNRGLFRIMRAKFTSFL
ncbi:hypothetical protein, partial [Paramaledivibacter caminithermalis]